MTGPVVYDQHTQTFHCLGCFAHMEIRRRTIENPEAFMTEYELHQLDHSECEKYQDIEKAQAARKYRKAFKRLQLVAGRVH